MEVLLNLFLLFIASFSLSAQEKPIVIVELFTSEGCSSCPPADRLLSKIVSEANEEVEVIGLSFHVDYWDYIGWKDPYGSEDFTIRQRAYARRFISNTIYTPQMVVNGKHEFVGSSRGQLQKALKKETGRNLVMLEVSDVKIESGVLQVSIRGEGIEQSLLNVAVVEKGLSQSVTRGENTGKILAHDNVVRAFDSRQFDGSQNTFKLELPKDLDLSKATLVAYSQNEKSWYVNAASKTDLKSFL